MTPQQLAQAYVEAIEGNPNAWGQYCHPTQGRSDHIMLRLWQAVGEIEGNRLIDEAVTAWLATEEAQ